ncbi:hypothetical protein LOD99_2378 [Oopsacas minuta]|uniref:Uncharacterized protein n=1 Tax=Oopsacas minuta TaxID=111878 RepID=A0AAV7K312_9METZ|nr:hypothetical protein LOD99_2378 [Oopsacas minuta]
MARKFSLGNLIGKGEGENKINFHNFRDAIKTKWKTNLNIGGALRKSRTDTNFQKLKDDLSRALDGDIASLNRVKEYTLKRKMQLKVSVPKEEFHILEDADFIHQILTECDQISPGANVFKSEKGCPIKKMNSGSDAVMSKPKLNENERNELYMLSAIAYDLISLEESQKNPTNVSKDEIGLENSLTLMQEVLHVPKDLIKGLEERVHTCSEYGFYLSVDLHQAQNTKTTIQDSKTQLYCRVGYISREAVEHKKLNLDGKGTLVHTSQSVADSQNPVWEENYKLPLISKADYLLIELWKSKTNKKGTKSSDEHLNRCLIKLDSHMEEINDQMFDLISTSGKGTQWEILLSIKIIASASQLNFLTQYDSTEKLEIYRTFTCELTLHLNRNNITLNFNKYIQPFERIKNKLVEILDLNHFQVRAIAFECAELWSQSRQLSREDVEICVAMLNSHWDTTDNILSTGQRTRLIKQICNLLEHEMKRLEYLLIEFPPTQLNSIPCVETLFSIVFGTYTFLLNRTALEFITNYDANYDINNDITKRLIKGISTWYKDTSQAILIRTTPKSQLESLVTLCELILLLMESSDLSYKDAISVASIDYSNLIVFTIDKGLSKEIEETAQLILTEEPKIGEDINKLYFMAFLLYRKVSLILKKIVLSKSAVNTFKLSSLDEWFRSYLNHWILALREVSMKNIETTIEIESDDDIHEYKGIKVSSSAIDIALCLLPSYLFYNKLEDWVDIQDRFHLALQTIQLNVDALLKYSQRMSERVSNLVKDINPFELSTATCVLLNNGYCIRHYLEEAPERMHWENLKSFLEEGVQKNAIYELIECCLGKISAIEWECMRNIGKVFKPQFSTFYTEFISTPQPAEDAIDNLMKWLLRIVNTAIQNLSSELFIPLLEEMWRRTLECIAEYKDPLKSKGNNSKILESLVILYEFFDNDGKGIGTEKIDGTIYDSLVEHFSLYLHESHELIMMFGRDVSEFCRHAPDKRGSCNFSVAFLVDKEILEINIIQVGCLPTPNTSGSVSVYLQASVLPKYYETKNYECKTELKKYESSMVIDELISIAVAKLGMQQGFLLQISLYYRSSHKMGIYSEYGGSMFLTSDYIGQMKSTGSMVDLLTGKNEVRKPIKMSFVDPGEYEILSILRERRHEDAIINGFIDSVTRGVKEGRRLTDGIEGTKKFLNKFRK